MSWKSSSVIALSVSEFDAELSEESLNRISCNQRLSSPTLDILYNLNLSILASTKSMSFM